MQDPDAAVDERPANGALHDVEPLSPTVDTAPATTEAPVGGPASAPGAIDEATKRAVDNVLFSDIGVSTLLNRLKQSIASVKDFSTFLKKRSSLEDEHAKELRRLCKATHTDIRRADSRQDSYSRQFEAVTSLHERMAENGLQFALNLHQMYDDLNQLSFEMEKGRKNWKQVGLSAEQKVQDAERQMEKAKQKYDSLAEDYDHARTGDKTGRHFGLRGPKSAEQREEELHRKLQAADQDYQQKVQYARQEREQLLATIRPQAIKALQDLIAETDNGVALQMQKLATFNERLLLGNGLLVSPLNEPGSLQQRSMRDLIAQIDNTQDFHNYVRSFSGKIPVRSGEIEYRKHPTLVPAQQPVRQPEPQIQPTAPPKDQSPPQPRPPQQQGLPQQAPPQFPMQQFQPQVPPQAPVIPPQNFNSYNAPYEQPAHDRFQQHPPPGPAYGPTPGQPPYPGAPSPYGRAPYPNGPGPGPGPGGPMRPPTRDGGLRGQMQRPERPVFGLSLDELFRRDQSPVPGVVYQCIQAVELFGLDNEGIYRVSGNNQKVQELKALFDNDNGANRIDFRNPETFNHDVNVPANLLKQFLRELSDPLLTREHYDELIDAARIPDDMVRRDSMHAIINALPDPNYATLRAVVLHLHRVDQHSEHNRMTPTNLAVVFAPTLMGAHTGQMSDASLQPKVIETILHNALQIFDED